MTEKEAIVLLECSAVDLTGTLASTTSPSVAKQLQRYIDAYDMAIEAIRAQQNQKKECAECSGIVYRQTDSGTIIPITQRCGAKLRSGCVPDGANTLIKCQECKLHGNCFVEDHFNFAGIEDPFCCVGKRKENTGSTRK